MDSTIVEVSPDGRVRYLDDPVWRQPSLQERRAILYSANLEMEALTELMARLEGLSSG
jgi:hypothetical protein